MKYSRLPIILFSLVLIVGCSKPDPNAIPEELSAKKEMLRLKQKEQRELTKLIGDIETASAKQDPDAEVPAKLVATTSVSKGDLKHFVDIQGKVIAKGFASASSEIGGRLLSVIGEEGQYIKRGTLIATVDVQSINKQMDEINTALSLDKDAYERQERLWSQKIGSELQYLQAKNQVERLEQSLKTLEFQLTKANVYAPISGNIDMVMKDPGEIAAPGEPIIRILNTQNLKAEIDVPENYLPSIRRGNKVDISVPAVNEDFKGAVTLIGNSVDPSSRTFKVEVSMPGKSSLVKPNLLVTMKLNDETMEDVVIIPVDLVQQEVTGKDFVYIVGEQEGEPVAEKIYIETGLSYQGQIAVLSGLDGSESLITKGALSLNAGENIKITSSTNQANG